MSGNDQEIQTFVILHLKSIGRPWEDFERRSIREISLCAFPAKYLLDKDDYSMVVLNEVASVGIPELPPVLNKITLMVCPSDVTDDGIEEVTVMNYEMLKNESPFDEGTADCINNFLGRLKKPICLVAHNGRNYDFPIIQDIYEQIDKAFPSGIFCVDSYKAFREIDKTYELIRNGIVDETIAHGFQIILKEIKQASLTQKLDSNFSFVVNKIKSLQLTDYNPSEMLRAKRELFDDELIFDKFPVKGTYPLGNIYRRCFPGREPLNLHSAEGDVAALTTLVLYYGIDFLAYAEQRKILLANVPILDLK